MENQSIKMTPMMKQFFSVKAQHPEALLLFRCGDFYETYGDDALTASKVLGIVLTKRSNANDDSPAMAGFPHHSIETYLPKLVRAGYKVAVCDQLEDPKFAKSIVRRGITDLVTPGVVFNDNILSQKENNFIAALCYDNASCGVAFLDVTTGSFQLSQGSLDFIGTLLGSFEPKELLVCRGFEKGTAEKFGDKYFISTMESWAFAGDSCREKLCKQLDVESLKGFAVDRYPLGINAAGALLSYLEQTQHFGLRNICTISRIDEGKFVWMDQFTLRNLEVFSSAGGKDGVSLFQVMDGCRTPLGSRLLKRWLSMPSVDLEELGRRYDIIDFFISRGSLLESVRNILSGIGDTERVIARAAAGKITPREVQTLSRSLSSGAALKSALSDCAECQALCGLLDRFNDCEALGKQLAGALVENPASVIGKGDIIAPGMDKELDELREISRGGKQYLLDLQQREMDRTGITSLKVSYNSVFGYYLEVRNVHKDKVPEDWIRRQTLVNAERYITQELKDYENKILGAEERIYEIESRIFSSLIELIREHIPEIQTNCGLIAGIDVLSCFADTAIRRSYCRPVMGDSSVIDITDGRHPVIETMMDASEEYVPNSIHLDSNSSQIIILTGPNMAGKSALLRQTALICLMAQTGSFVPASKATLGWCDKIFTRVGASDNISRGESTFMVEMLETSMILNNLSARSLVLLDEIGRGTSTYDGMAIARAIVEYLHGSPMKPKTLFATHYHELNDMADNYPRVKNFHIAVKEIGKKVIFLRKMMPGGTERSFGVHVARMAGMPPAVVSSAERTLKLLESTDKKTAMSPSGEQQQAVQLSLFQLDDPLLSDLRDTLKEADLNNMTPLQAFDLLRSMKSKMGI
ncbi:MAG: DNA mismatch repair protein MutS [Bacteroidales bacterium]|nr:DNA mismatch repair protein MutS [Bacteroidales bacterium]